MSYTPGNISDAQTTVILNDPSLTALGFQNLVQNANNLAVVDIQVGLDARIRNQAPKQLPTGFIVSRTVPQTDDNGLPIPGQFQQVTSFDYSKLPKGVTAQIDSESGMLTGFYLIIDSNLPPNWPPYLSTIMANYDATGKLVDFYAMGTGTGVIYLTIQGHSVKVYPHWDATGKPIINIDSSSGGFFKGLAQGVSEIMKPFGVVGQIALAYATAGFSEYLQAGAYALTAVEAGLAAAATVQLVTTGTISPEKLAQSAILQYAGGAIVNLAGDFTGIDIANALKTTLPGAVGTITNSVINTVVTDVLSHQPVTFNSLAVAVLGPSGIGSTSVPATLLQEFKDYIAVTPNSPVAGFTIDSATGLTVAYNDPLLFQKWLNDPTSVNIIEGTDSQNNTIDFLFPIDVAPPIINPSVISSDTVNAVNNWYANNPTADALYIQAAAHDSGIPLEQLNEINLSNNRALIADSTGHIPILQANGQVLEFTSQEQFNAWQANPDNFTETNFDNKVFFSNITTTDSTTVQPSTQSGSTTVTAFNQTLGQVNGQDISLGTIVVASNIPLGGIFTGAVGESGTLVFANITESAAWNTSGGIFGSGNWTYTQSTTDPTVYYVSSAETSFTSTLTNIPILRNSVGIFNGSPVSGTFIFPDQATQTAWLSGEPYQLVLGTSPGTYEVILQTDSVAVNKTPAPLTALSTTTIISPNVGQGITVLPTAITPDSVSFSTSNVYRINGENFQFPDEVSYNAFVASGGKTVPGYGISSSGNYTDSSGLVINEVVPATPPISTTVIPSVIIPINKSYVAGGITYRFADAATETAFINNGYSTAGLNLAKIENLGSGVMFLAPADLYPISSWQSISIDLSKPATIINIDTGQTLTPKLGSVPPAVSSDYKPPLVGDSASMQPVGYVSGTVQLTPGLATQVDLAVSAWEAANPGVPLSEEQYYKIEDAILNGTYVPPSTQSIGAPAAVAPAADAAANTLTTNVQNAVSAVAQNAPSGSVFNITINNYGSQSTVTAPTSYFSGIIDYIGNLGTSFIKFIGNTFTSVINGNIFSDISAQFSKLIASIKNNGIVSTISSSFSDLINYIKTSFLFDNSVTQYIKDQASTLIANIQSTELYKLVASTLDSITPNFIKDIVGNLSVGNITTSSLTSTSSTFVYDPTIFTYLNTGVTTSTVKVIDTTKLPAGTIYNGPAVTNNPVVPGYTGDYLHLENYQQSMYGKIHTGIRYIPNPTVMTDPGPLVGQVSTILNGNDGIH